MLWRPKPALDVGGVSSLLHGCHIPVGGRACSPVIGIEALRSGSKLWCEVGGTGALSLGKEALGIPPQEPSTETCALWCCLSPLCVLTKYTVETTLCPISAEEKLAIRLQVLRRCAHKSASGVNPWKSRTHQESVQISAPLLCVGNLQVCVCAPRACRVGAAPSASRLRMRLLWQGHAPPFALAVTIGLLFVLTHRQLWPGPLSRTLGLSLHGQTESSPWVCLLKPKSQNPAATGEHSSRYVLWAGACGEVARTFCAGLSLSCLLQACCCTHLCTHLKPPIWPGWSPSRWRGFPGWGNFSQLPPGVQVLFPFLPLSSYPVMWWSFLQLWLYETFSQHSVGVLWELLHMWCSFDVSVGGGELHVLLLHHLHLPVCLLFSYWWVWTLYVMILMY